VRLRTGFVVLLALVCGGTAAYFSNALLSRAPAATPPETVPVVVAAADAARFATLTPGQVETREFPKDLVPPGAYDRVENVVNRMTLTPLAKGEVVLPDKLAPAGGIPGLANDIEEGKRAFTIQTPTVASNVAGFVEPGNKVDVLLTVSQGGNDSAAVTLVQNVKILAVAQRLEPRAGTKVDVKDLHSVTLLVTPRQAARLEVGQSKGTLHLALRHPKDNRHEAVPPEFLFEQPPKPAAPEPPPPPVQIRTFRGAREGAVHVHPAR
jgi:pilus assembly protein CpaB